MICTLFACDLCTCVFLSVCVYCSCVLCLLVCMFEYTFCFMHVAFDASHF